MNKQWLVLLSGVLIGGAMLVAVRGVNAQPSNPIGDSRPSAAIVVRVRRHPAPSPAGGVPFAPLAPTKVCPRCGGAISPGARFCGNCGEPLAT